MTKKSSPFWGRKSEEGKEGGRRRRRENEKTRLKRRWKG